MSKRLKSTMNPGTGIFNEMRLNRHRFYGTKFHGRAEVMDAFKKRHGRNFRARWG